MAEGELELVNRFRRRFNRLEAWLRSQTDMQIAGLPSVIRAYASKHPGWADASVVEGLARLRNVIAHKDGLPEYMAVPTPESMAALESVYNDLVAPALAGKAFRRQVAVVSPGQPLSEVLVLIHDNDYSQFPVVVKRSISGLLTENGIAHWLARHAKAGTLDRRLATTKVEHVLAAQKERDVHTVVGPRTPVREVEYAFGQRPTLEAVLLTPTGKPTLPIIGIATQWDILSLKG